jgi:hypothetical protein
MGPLVVHPAFLPRIPHHHWSQEEVKELWHFIANLCHLFSCFASYYASSSFFLLTEHLRLAHVSPQALAFNESMVFEVIELVSRLKLFEWFPVILASKEVELEAKSQAIKSKVVPRSLLVPNYLITQLQSFIALKFQLRR